MTNLVWHEVAPDSGNAFTFAEGDRYAVLASVSRNFTLDQVRKYMTDNGWQLTYAWEQGTPTRDTYAIDAWLAKLAPDPTANHRWVYGEANRVGADWTKGADAPWPFTIYHIAHVFEAVPGQEPAPLPASSSSSSSSKTGAVVAGVGLVAAVAIALRLALRAS